MKPPFRDDHGIVEFVDGIEPMPEAVIAGFMTYHIIGINPATGNRIGEALITKNGMEYFEREFPLEFREANGSA